MSIDSYTLIKDVELNRIYTFNGNWILLSLSEPLTKQDYINNGIQDIEDITKEQWSLLDFNEIEILSWLSEENDFNIVIESNEEFIPIEFLINPKLKIWTDADAENGVCVILDVLAETQVKFLISKDNRITWQTYDGNNWKNVLLSEIHESGMYSYELHNIDKNTWKQWFSRHYIDFAIGIKTQNLNNSPKFENITFTFPKNEAPIVSDFNINPSEIERDNVILSAKINDLEGDFFKYRIYNASENKEKILGFNDNNHISIPHTLNISPDKVITVEFDMRIHNFANTWMPVIYKGNNRQYSIWVNSNGRVYVGSAGTDGVQRILYTASLPNPLQLNTYYHIAVVINRENGYIKLYKNGELWDTTYMPLGTTMSIQNFPLLIGRTTEVSNAYSNFEGNIQNVRLWNIERTEEEINEFKNMRILGDLDNLIGNWFINDDSFIIKDYSQFNNSGIATGTNWNLNYKFYFIENKWSEWSEWINGDLEEYSLYKIYPYTAFKIGKNLISIEVTDDRGLKYTTPIRIVEMINDKPIMVISTIDNWSIKGVVDDPNGDKVKYRILINGVQKFPKNNKYTEYINVPFNLNYTWDSSDLVIGLEHNELTIEIVDIFGAEHIIKFDNIIGMYKNIMFKVRTQGNEDKDFYSDDKGQLLVWDNNLLSYLDFGIITAGQVSLPEPVYLTNQFGEAVENVRVWHEGVTGFDIDLSKDQSFTNPQNEIEFNEILQDGDQRIFYVRVRTAPLSTGNGGVFEIKTKGDIVT